MNHKSTITLKISGMHCTSCSLNIDGELEETPGIISSNTSYAKSQTQITYYGNLITPEKIQTIIKSLGYSLGE